MIRIVSSAGRPAEVEHPGRPAQPTGRKGRSSCGSLSLSRRGRAEVSMLFVRSRRWLLATAMFPRVLAACTGTADRPGSGTGAVGRDAGSGSAAPGGRQGSSAVRHVWVIELENQGYAQSFGTPSADPYLARTLPRLLRTIEDSFGLPHLGDAAMPQVRSFGPDVSG